MVGVGSLGEVGCGSLLEFPFLYPLVKADQWRNNSRKNERMEPNKNNAQLWMGLVIEARSDAVKSNIAQEPGMLGP